MSHKSELASTINISIASNDVFDFSSDIVFFELPYFISKKDHSAYISKFGSCFNDLNNLSAHATICILCSPLSAFELFPQLEKKLHFKLLVSIKLKTPLERQGYINNAYGSLLIFTRYSAPLKHTKTRIAYSYCPACGKTTKDYGGKKHLFDAYGTILSDVWRDIQWDTSTAPHAIIERVADLFSIAEYKSMTCYLNSHTRSLIYSKDILYDSSKSIPKSNVDSALICGDVLDELAKIPNDSIDYCFADPPYNLKKTYNNWNDNIDITNYFAWCDTWIRELVRVTKPGGVLSVINIPQWAARHYQFLANVMNLVDIITWEGLSMPVRMIMPANYSILCFSKGSPALINPLSDVSHNPGKEYLLTQKEFYCSRAACIKSRGDKKDAYEPVANIWWDIHRLKHNSRRVDHPCQLPPMLMYRLLSLFTKPGDVVLDPFNGSGTTTLVAQQLNRKYIGIELSKAYYDISVQRHYELEHGLDPFRKRDDLADAKSKNSYVKRMPKIKYKVSKKTLQLELKALALKLGRTPTEADIKQCSAYPLEYFQQYFINWSEAVAATRSTGMSELPVSQKTL